MSIAKISILIGASIVTAGSSAAVATRDKWWTERETKSTSEADGSASPKTPPVKVSEDNGTTGLQGSDSDRN